MGTAFGISVRASGQVLGTKGFSNHVEVLWTGGYRVRLDIPYAKHEYAVLMTCTSPPMAGSYAPWVQKQTAPATDMFVIIKTDDNPINTETPADFDLVVYPYNQGDFAMRGCSVESDIMVTKVTGTRGINATATRLGPGNVRVTLDQPLAPHEYAVNATLTDGGGGVFVRKMLNGSVAQLDVTTTYNGFPVDNDFDLSILPFYV